MFDPVYNKLYTTMDCEFFEGSYYFSQLGRKGESVGDDLSWLTYPARMDPLEQVGNTADTATDHIVSSPQITPVLSDEHPRELEVTPKLFFDDMPGTVPTDDVLLSNDVLNIQNRYELPPRSTRGIPLKRYSRHQHGKKKER